MLLEQVGNVNDISPTLRKKLEERVASFGKNVRYKFAISNPNPDPEKRNGSVIWPSRWTLDPLTFRITDKDETREGKSKLKLIGLIDKVNADNKVESYKRVRILEGNKGLLFLDLEKNEDFQMAMYIELHPKLQDGLFADKNGRQLISRIDEKRFAEEKRTERSAKLKALKVAEEMSDAEVQQFADAMLWDSTEETPILRNKIEDLAETDAKMFSDLVSGKNLEIQATIKRAIDKAIIRFDPTEYKFIWLSNNQPIAVLQPTADKNEVQKLAEWFLMGGGQSEQALKKVKDLLKTS